MNRITYTAILIIGIVLITYYSHWWLIVILCGVLSYYYDKNIKEKIAIVTFMTILIWTGIAIYQEASVVNRASDLVAQIFGNIAPSLMFTITALVISIPCVMATGLGHRLRKEFARN